MIGPRQHKKKQLLRNKGSHSVLAEYYAKTYRTEFGKVKAGRTVFSHCRIVGEIARELIRRTSVNLSQSIFPVGSELVAASHDVGKVSPTFQKKILQNTDNYTPDKYPVFEGVNPILERNWGGHPGVSQIALEAAGVGKYIPEIVGQHHGYSPQMGIYRATGESFGGQDWQIERVNLLQKLQKTLKVEWPEIATPEQARLLYIAT